MIHDSIGKQNNKRQKKNLARPITLNGTEIEMAACYGRGSAHISQIAPDVFR
jgi:hypothetical protein